MEEGKGVDEVSEGRRKEALVAGKCVCHWVSPDKKNDIRENDGSAASCQAKDDGRTDILDGKESC